MLLLYPAFAEKSTREEVQTGKSKKRGIFFAENTKTGENRLTGNKLSAIISKQDHGGVAQLVRALP